MSLESVLKFIQDWNLIPVTIMVLMFDLGLSLTPAEVIAPWKRGQAWVRALLAVVILPPLLAILANLGLPPNSPLGIVLLGLAAAPGAPMTALRVVKAGGKLHSAVSLQIAVSILAVFTIPLWALIYAAILPVELTVDLKSIIAIIARIQLIPIGVGLAIRQFQPSIANRLEGVMSKVANLFFIGLILLILVATSPILLKVGLTPFLVFIPMVAAWIVMGHFIGGPVLAIGSIARNVGLVLLLLNFSEPPERVKAAIPLLLAYLLIGAIGGVVYSKLAQKSNAPDPEISEGDAGGISGEN